MPCDPADLRRRTAAASTRDTVRGLIFNAMFDVIREHAGEEVARRCDPRGEGHRTDFFGYPVAEYLEIAWCGADALEQTAESVDRAFWLFGHRAARTELASLIGRAFTSFVGRDPRRMMSNAAHGYRATVSYGQRRTEWLGDRHARLTFRRDFLVPPFHCGVLTAALEATGVRRIEVTGRQTGFLESEYEVTWEP